jgi:prolipoprotein diacylglyceryltransferase
MNLKGYENITMNVKCYLLRFYWEMERTPSKVFGVKAVHTMQVLFFIYFLLGIFLIYISNAIPKVPDTLPLHSPTHPLLIFGPGFPLYWGI